MPIRVPLVVFHHGNVEWRAVAMVRQQTVSVHVERYFVHEDVGDEGDTGWFACDANGEKACDPYIVAQGDAAPEDPERAQKLTELAQKAETAVKVWAEAVQLERETAQFCKERASVLQMSSENQ